MKKYTSIFSLVFIASLATGCSDDRDKDEAKPGDHVWKQQTDTLKTSKDVAKQLQDSLNQQQKTIDENN